jgi:protein gp37
MSDQTSIAWTEATWNPWMGCTKVSAGCDNCYMFREQRQYGNDPELVRRSKTKFADPLKWKEPRRIFTCSWSDWFHKDADAWRDEAWAIIKATPQHTYQILTKRPGRIARHLPADWGVGYPNVWLGVSIESQEQAFRARQLAEIPAVVRWLSCEPLLGPLSFEEVWASGPRVRLEAGGVWNEVRPVLSLIHWLVVGGESGPDTVRREMKLLWAEMLQRECRDAGTAFFFKQRSARRSEDTTGVPEWLLKREYPARPLPFVAAGPPGGGR